MKVLSLVTTPRPFYKKQVEVLQNRGIDVKTIEVPKDSITVPGRHDDRDRRGYTDYIRYYPKVLTESIQDYDIVHANYGLTAPFALAQPRRPAVLTLWGSDVVGEFGWLTNYCAPHFDAVTVRSKEMLEELSTDAFLLPSGVDMEEFYPISREAAISDVGWDKDKKHVLFPYSETYSRKNYPRARKIVEEVDSISENDIIIKTMSGVPHDEVAIYMNASDAMILTSDHEGSPNTIKEALACNTPIVSTDVGDVRERVAGVNGTFICNSDQEFVNYLRKIINDEVTCDGRENVRDVNLESMGDKLITIYEEFL